jgi:hypothetical protein
MEQERAFRIVAEHASAPNNEPLRMYIGGMGGAGKSQVFNSIAKFFNERSEEYRFMVLGPTGGSAALLKGSTYHSVFKIPREAKMKSKNQEDTDGIRNEANAIAAINERIQGVEYILLDEISMVSCNDLQLLASQAAKARNIHNSERYTGWRFCTTAPHIRTFALQQNRRPNYAVYEPKNSERYIGQNFVASIQHGSIAETKYAAKRSDTRR